MFHVYSVPLTTLVKEFELEVAYQASDYESIQLTVADVARPGLQPPHHPSPSRFASRHHSKLGSTGLPTG